MKSILIAFVVATSITLGPDSFDLLFERISPKEGEIWRSIPWETELLEAQAMAAKAQKPLFIWAMDGHPLGCT
ncbi:MAG: hypothetical protein AAF357_07905 [Verrucomicrobiota bacterium]